MRDASVPEPLVAFCDRAVIQALDAHGPLDTEETVRLTLRAVAEYVQQADVLSAAVRAYYEAPLYTSATHTARMASALRVVIGEAVTIEIAA